MNQPIYRTLRFGITRVELSEGAPGVRYMRAEQPLQVYSQRITDRLKLWAMTRPDQTFMARRARLTDGSTGDWIHLTYAQAWDSARSIAQALINRGLSADKPVVILSENDLEHALLALGCHHFQGYLFGKPMAADQFLQFCQSQTPAADT